jgi:hypothetical protein
LFGWAANTPTFVKAAYNFSTFFFLAPKKLYLLSCNCITRVQLLPKQAPKSKKSTACGVDDLVERYYKSEIAFIKK